MTNYIDEKFYNLVEEIEQLNFYEIYTHMVKSFKSIPLLTQKSLEKYFNNYPYWGQFNIEDENLEVFYKKAVIFKENLNDYVWLYNELKDYRSKYLLFSILNNFYNFDFFSLKNSKEFMFKQYFDLNIVPKCKDEVFVDIGSYVGDTVLDFVESYGEDSYKKIYCYEITKDILEQSKINLQNLNNIKFVNKAVANMSGEIGIEKNDSSLSANKTSISATEKVKCVKLDDDIKEPVSIIKMDIEGGEKDALLGAANHIVNDLPKLFISVYHNNSDLFEIPKMIKNMVPSYNFYLRYYGGCVYPTEIVLICLNKNN